MSDRITPGGVVVGVDGSPSSSIAVRWAVDEAALRHVGLTVVHAMPYVPVTATALEWSLGRLAEELLEIQEREARRIVAEAAALAEEVAGTGRPEINWEAFFGNPVATLADLSKDADLVVVGCRGKSGQHRRLLGSVSTGLIHHAHGPVAVVHDEAPAAGQTEHRPVLVGVDGSQTSELAIDIAFNEASWRGVDLVALHIWSDVDMPSTLGLETSSLQTAAEEVLAERLAGWQEQYPEVRVHRLVRYDHPAAQLLEASERAQLVVVGSHGRGGFAGMLLGSVSTVVAEEARVPVIVARHG